MTKKGLVNVQEAESASPRLSRRCTANVIGMIYAKCGFQSKLLILQYTLLHSGQTGDQPIH